MAEIYVHLGQGNIVKEAPNGSGQSAPLARNECPDEIIDGLESSSINIPVAEDD